MRLKTGNHDPRTNEAEKPEPQPDIKEAERRTATPDKKRQLIYLSGGSQ